MILINNDQDISLDTKKLESSAQKILDLLEYSEFDLGILLTDNKTIQEYNRKYRDKDKPTDILSFPYHADLKPEQRIAVNNDDDKNLGDMIINPEYVQTDAQDQNISFDQHMQRILVHGICHLLGYDHIEDKDYEIMHAKETEILEKIRAEVSE